ncbi:uncharacterized protein LOC122013512 [Zingiber officinale]|uniref:uncharacterized protein LOC122013512 n=1 Tax=Zingiber officinale TaxID=94328 RepID=UPI001C4D9BB1|nr:uncharacterized protein LOC122013512 [Zingiber officinale]
MEVKDDDDIRALVDSIAVVESTSYPQLYVKTRKYRVKGRRSALSEPPFEPSLGTSIYDEAGPSHEVIEYFPILIHSDVPLPESIDIPIATNDCQSNPSEEEDSDGLLGQDDCEEEAMIEVPEAFQFTIGANYPVSADWIGSVGNTVGMVVGTEFDTTLEFREKEDVINAIKQYSLNCSQEYEVAELSSRVWSVVCRNTKYGCSWQLRAARLKKFGGEWGTTRYKGKHERLNRRLLPEFGVIGMNHTNVYHISLQLCNRQILKVLYGEYLMITLMSGIVQIEFNKKNLRRLFWSFKPAIDSIEFTKSMIQIDGTFLYGKYKHSLLIATTIDGDNSVIPLVYALVESENVDSWGWFMALLRT